MPFEITARNLHASCMLHYYSSLPRLRLMTNTPNAFSQPFSSLLIFSKVLLCSTIQCWVQDVDEHLHLENKSCLIFTKLKYVLRVYFVVYSTFYILAALGTNWLQTYPGELPLIKPVVLWPLLLLPHLQHLVLVFLCSYDSVLTNKALKMASLLYPFFHSLSIVKKVTR